MRDLVEVLRNRGALKDDYWLGAAADEIEKWKAVADELGMALELVSVYGELEYARFVQGALAKWQEAKDGMPIV